MWWSNRKKNWTTTLRLLVPTIGIGLTYLPWLYLVGRTLRKHGLSEKLSVLERPRFRDLLWFYESLKGQPPIRHTAFLGLLLFLIPVLVALVYRPERRCAVSHHSGCALPAAGLYGYCRNVSASEKGYRLFIVSMGGSIRSVVHSSARQEGTVGYPGALSRSLEELGVHI